MLHQRNSIEGQPGPGQVLPPKELFPDCESKEQQKLKIAQIIKEYQQQLEILDTKAMSEKDGRESKDDKQSERDERPKDSYSNRQFKEPERVKTKPNEIEKHSNSKRREIEEIHTPKKNLDQSIKSNFSNNPPPNFPQYITGSMRKIRKSPPLAENEEFKENDESPNSIIHHYDDEDEKKNKTVYRLKNSSIDIEGIQNHKIDSNPIKSIHDDKENSEDRDDADEDTEFKPDPDLLARLNENMLKNDVSKDVPFKYKETEEQRKRREERERIEKEREKERQKLLELFNDPNNN